jgi:hypothetical protein
MKWAAALCLALSLAFASFADSLAFTWGLRPQALCPPPAAAGL